MPFEASSSQLNIKNGAIEVAKLFDSGKRILVLLLELCCEELIRTAACIILWIKYDSVPEMLCSNHFQKASVRRGAGKERLR